jgi:hypothetical protein
MPDGGYGLLEVECCRGGTRANLPFDRIGGPRHADLDWKPR